METLQAKDMLIQCAVAQNRLQDAIAGSAHHGPSPSTPPFPHSCPWRKCAFIMTTPTRAMALILWLCRQLVFTLATTTAVVEHEARLARVIPPPPPPSAHGGVPTHSEDTGYSCSTGSLGSIEKVLRTAVVSGPWGGRWNRHPPLSRAALRLFFPLFFFGLQFLQFLETARSRTGKKEENWNRIRITPWLREWLAQGPKLFPPPRVGSCGRSEQVAPLQRFFKRSQIV